MGDRSRRRGSIRDIVDEDRPPYTDEGYYREYSDIPDNNISRHRDHSRWSAGEEMGDSILKDKIDSAETRELLHNSSHYRSMSPGFDGSKQQKWSNAPDKKWSQSRRYGESRRSRSRSCSPGWNRRRSHARDMSRSRSKGSTRGNSRSRSPFYDQGPESHRWSDRKSERGRSSQTCKDFVAGMCRRGSQCRFLHSDNVPRDDEPLDSDIDGRKEYKQEPGHGSKYHYDKAVDKFSDRYHRNNESSQSRSRGSVTCRDFVKGNCRYGESCRFSHSAENDNGDRSFRNVPGDPGHGHNLNEARRSLCKFFLAGNCRRDNCRFSHDTPLSSEHEDIIHDNIGGGNVVTLDKREHPLWGEPENLGNTRTISKWSASVDADMDLSEDVSVGRRGDGRFGFTLDDGTKRHDDNNLNRDYQANNRTNDEDSRHMVSAKAMVIEKSLGEPQQTMTYEYPRSPSVDKMSPHFPRHNLGGEATQHYLSSPPAYPQVVMTSGSHQYQGMTEHSRGLELESNVLYELKECKNSNGQVVSSEIRSAYRDDSSVLNMKGQQMMSPISNAQKADLNEFGHVVFSSNLNDQINRGQSTIQHMQEPGAYSSFPVQALNDQFAPLNTFPISVSSDHNIQTAHASKIYLDELKTQLHTVLEPSTLMKTAPSQSSLHPVPADCPQNISNSTMSIDQHPLLKNGTIAISDQMARELLSSLSGIDPQLSTLYRNGDPTTVDGNDDSKENLQEATKELETNDNGGKLNMSSKIEADNNCSNIGDEQEKEGGNNHKDDKVIRLFKIALVELVKDILKPKWKEGKMSREVHKTVVKKTVDKVTVTIQAEHVPKTQEKVEQYLSSNRPKISKLVQAYVERSLKAGS